MSRSQTGGTTSTGLSFFNVLVRLMGVSILLLSACSTHGVPAGGRGSGLPSGVPVTVAFAETRDVPQLIRVVGNVEAYSTISVTAQIGGELTKGGQGGRSRNPRGPSPNPG